MATKRLEYEGTPLIALQSNKFVMQFGFSKANMIVEHIDDIKQFVEEIKNKTKEKQNA